MKKLLNCFLLLSSFFCLIVVVLVLVFIYLMTKGKTYFFWTKLVQIVACLYFSRCRCWVRNEYTFMCFIINIIAVPYSTSGNWRFFNWENTFLFLLQNSQYVNKWNEINKKKIQKKKKKKNFLYSEFCFFLLQQVKVFILVVAKTN